MPSLSALLAQVYVPPRWDYPLMVATLLVLLAVPLRRWLRDLRRWWGRVQERRS